VGGGKRRGPWFASSEEVTSKEGGSGKLDRSYGRGKKAGGLKKNERGESVWRGRYTSKGGIGRETKHFTKRGQTFSSPTDTGVKKKIIPIEKKGTKRIVSNVPKNR